MTTPHKSPSIRRTGRALAVACIAIVVGVSCGSSSSSVTETTTGPTKLPVDGVGSFAPASVACSGISIYPSPDTSHASPTTQITFRNVASADITAEAVTVTGSESGSHPGRVVADSDGQGASLFPDKPFSPGETVTVAAPKKICGADAKTAEFEVAKQKTAALPEDDSEPTKKKPTTAADLQHFVSEPDLTPPVLEVTKKHPDPSEGLYVMGSKGGTVQGGPMIVDGDGQLVWYREMPKGEEATDVRVAEYQGKPVLTWWQGASEVGHGKGVGIIADHSYDTIATVKAGNGFHADLHEFRLASDGTAWVVAYHETPADMSKQDGPKNAPVFDGIVQRIDVATGNVLFEWHSLDHIDIDAAYEKYSPDDPDVYDYFHINSVESSGEGTVLISARNTSAVYLLNEATGEVIWTLGGKDSSFDMGDGTTFKFQHDARFRGDHHVTIFDNQSGQTPARLIAVSLDLDKMKASLTWGYEAPGSIPVAFQGNVQILGNGNIIGGWGSSNVDGPTKYSSIITEYTDEGEPLFEAGFKGTGINTYRAFRAPWKGLPDTEPKAKLTTDDGDQAVAVSWNGATEVASWEIVAAGADGKVLATEKRAGFETLIPITDPPSGIQARALDAGGKVLGTVEVAS